MKHEELFFWWLPPAPSAGPRAKPYLSRFRMSRAQAAERGALHPEISSRVVIEVAETPEEELELRQRTDTSIVSGRGTR
jgi:hypothetical protein